MMMSTKNYSLLAVSLVRVDIFVICVINNSVKRADWAVFIRNVSQ